MKAISGFESVILPNNSQRGRHFSTNKLSHKQSFTTFSVAKRLKMVRATNRAGATSSFLFIVLVLAIIFPLYNIMGTEDTKAAVGTAVDSSITFTSTRTTATVDLTPTSASGTFASSSSGTTDAAFSITTTNSQGYELKIKSTSGTVLKPTTTTSDSDGLSTISTSGITSSSFANNTWGYLPNYYNCNEASGTCTTNTTNYYPATTSDVTLRKTTSANTTAHNYTIGLGAKANLTKTSGTYTLGGNSSSMVLSYVANPTTYSITFNKGNTTDTVNNMPYSSTNNNVSGSVSTTSITINDGVPTRTGYDFKGWCTVLPTTTDKVDTCKNSAGTTGTTYNATGATSWTYGIDRTSSNNVTLYALWSAKTYTITVNNGGNTTVGGTGTYKYGDTITLTATPTTNTTCATYGTPSWTKTSGEGTLNSASGTSVTFTVGLGDATITATSTKTDVKQTITLSRSNATNITIAGTSYDASTTSVSLDCGTYNITGTFPTGYKFSSWSRANGVAVASTSTLATTMTVSGAGTLTLNGTPNTYSLSVTFAGSGVSSVQIRTASGTSGTLMGTVSSSGGSVSGLAYNSTYYLYPVFSSGYEFSSWAKTSSYGTLSSTTTSNPTFKMGAGDGAVTITGKSSIISLGYMQDLTLDACKVATTSGYGATDKRDGKVYSVRYINNYCWMTQNLRFTGTSVDTTNSNVTSNKTLTWYSLKDNGASGGQCYGSGLSGDGYSNACLQDSGSTTTGIWYNYYGATAGTVSGTSNSTAASQDICPKNWHLPTGPSTTSGTDFNLLVGNTTSGYIAATTGLTAFSAVAGGVYYSGLLNYTGFGYWWSATANGDVLRYSLLYNGNTGQFNGNGASFRYNGYYVRCVRTS